MKTKYKYIYFEKTPVNEDEWDIWNNRHQDLIGRIKYYEPWKQYVFIGRDDCIFSASCLADIIDFIKQLEKK